MRIPGTEGPGNGKRVGVDTGQLSHIGAEWPWVGVLPTFPSLMGLHCKVNLRVFRDPVATVTVKQNSYIVLLCIRLLSA